MKRIDDTTAGMNRASFEQHWQKQWLVERGVEIISEASRHLSGTLKERHPDIPWKNIAGIGNIIRHGYDGVRPDTLWLVLSRDLPVLERARRGEFTRVSGQDFDSWSA